MLLHPPLLMARTQANGPANPVSLFGDDQNLPCRCSAAGVYLADVSQEEAGRSGGGRATGGGNEGCRNRSP